MSEALLAREPVRRVQAALDDAATGARVVALAETARTAADAARALGCPVGAIVKTLVFRAGERAVMALVAGDRACDMERLMRHLRLDRPAARADADFVRAATGFSIGGVAPVGHPQPLAIAIDESLGRFDRLWAAGGHPHCVFATTYDELCRISGGLAGQIAAADAPATAAAPGAGKGTS